MLVGRRDEPSAALRILPNDSEFAGKPRALGCALKGGVCVHLAGFRKRDQYRGPPDIQMSDRNRTI